MPNIQFSTIRYIHLIQLVAFLYGLLPIGVRSEVVEFEPSGKIGVTGIYLQKADDYPTIAWIFPGSPASKDNSLYSGIKITSVSSNGSEAAFASTRGVPIETVVPMLKGAPNSIIGLKVIANTGAGEDAETVVLLRRAEMVSVQLPNGTVSQGFYGTSRSRSLFEPNALDEFRRVSSGEWLTVTNGMGISDVLRTIGPPVRIDRGRNSDEYMWQYGWVVHFGVKTLEPGTTELFVTNGAVSQTFRIKQPPGDDYKVEVLSGKEDRH